jgi:hypothetical protein
MIFGYFTLLSALIISGIAAYYSIIGLTAIFAAALIPIIVMGVALELGKVVSAVWLHRNWHHAKAWMRGYLTFATIILMFITSMGIFGFLSKAHIEQTSASQESVAQIERLTTEINRQTSIITRSDEQIKKLETTGTGSDANIQSQIDKEQQRIDSAYNRVKPAIVEQQKIIDSQGGIYKDELTKIDDELAQLQKFIANGEIKKAQQMVGAKADGAFGSKTALAFTTFQERKKGERTALISKIENSINNSRAIVAREEIQRIRKSVETEIANSNALIQKLREKISAANSNTNIETRVDNYRDKISVANKEIDTLTQEKYALEAEYRKLEAEVGPVKYIAEFIYGEDANRNMLEDAVRWVIIILVLVFDPLAICLILAGTQQILWCREEQARIIHPTPPDPPVSPDDDPDHLNDPINEDDHETKRDGDHQAKHLDADEGPGDKKDLQTKIERADSDLILAAELAAELEDRNSIAEARIVELESALAHAASVEEESSIITEEEPSIIGTEEIVPLGTGHETFVFPDEIVNDTVTPTVETEPSDESVVLDETTEQYEESNDLDRDSSATTSPLSEDEIEKIELQLKNVNYQKGSGKALTVSPLFHAEADNKSLIASGFGSVFPTNQFKGDMFLRTDYLPSKLFKYNGNNWFETSKKLSSSYMYDTKYIEYLIDKLQTGEYELEDLEDQEQEQIRDYLQDV